MNGPDGGREREHEADRGSEANYCSEGVPLLLLHLLLLLLLLHSFTATYYLFILIRTLPTFTALFFNCYFSSSHYLLSA